MDENKEDLKVQIPEFVDDWLKDIKKNNYRVLNEISHLEDSLTSQNMREEHKLYFWLKENFDDFAKAWLSYPDVEIEEEKRYYVLLLRRDKNGASFNYLAKDNHNDRLWIEDSRTDGLTWDERSSFTEKEIRELDKGDVLFRHFAIKVEEMEE